MISKCTEKSFLYVLALFFGRRISFKEKSPTITVNKSFPQIEECMRSGRIQNF